MRFFENMEKVIQKHGEMGLEQVEFYYGVDLEIYREGADRKKSVYGRVHGKNAGADPEYHSSFVGVLVSDDFFTADDQFTGGFELGFCYTRSKEIKVGDTLRVCVQDGKERRFKVESKEDIGISNTVFEKWKLSNIGD
jgi:hypothetical protein